MLSQCPLKGTESICCSYEYILICIKSTLYLKLLKHYLKDIKENLGLIIDTIKRSFDLQVFLGIPVHIPGPGL